MLYFDPEEALFNNDYCYTACLLLEYQHIKHASTNNTNSLSTCKSVWLHALDASLIARSHPFVFVSHPSHRRVVCTRLPHGSGMLCIYISCFILPLGRLGSLASSLDKSAQITDWKVEREVDSSK